MIANSSQVIIRMTLEDNYEWLTKHNIFRWKNIFPAFSKPCCAYDHKFSAIDQLSYYHISRMPTMPFVFIVQNMCKNVSAISVYGREHGHKWSATYVYHVLHECKFSIICPKAICVYDYNYCDTYQLSYHISRVSRKRFKQCNIYTNVTIMIITMIK